MSSDETGLQSRTQNRYRLVNLLYFGGLVMWLYGVSMAVQTPSDFITLFAGVAIGLGTAAYLFIRSKVKE